MDENGRKIPDFQERRHSQEIMKELAPESGYTVGKKKEMDQIPDNPDEESKEAKECLATCIVNGEGRRRVILATFKEVLKVLSLEFLSMKRRFWSVKS